jgi:hypothetical protein
VVVVQDALRAHEQKVAPDVKKFKREGEVPAEPRISNAIRLGRRLALP